MAIDDAAPSPLVLRGQGTVVVEPRQTGRAAVRTEGEERDATWAMMMQPSEEVVLRVKLPDD